MMATNLMPQNGNFDRRGGMANKRQHNIAHHNFHQSAYADPSIQQRKQIVDKGRKLQSNFNQIQAKQSKYMKNIMSIPSYLQDRSESSHFARVEGSFDQKMVGRRNQVLHTQNDTPDFNQLPKAQHATMTNGPLVKLKSAFDSAGRASVRQSRTKAAASPAYMSQTHEPPRRV